MEHTDYEEIAIIGMAARFSNADSIDELWDNLRMGKDCVSDCPDERKKDIEDYLDFQNVAKESRVYRKAAYLNEIDKFDYEFFRISPKEAKIMDPNQRILLETTYTAMEDSGYSVDYFNNKKVGCYTGFPTEYTCKAYQNLLMEMSPKLANDSFAGNLVAMLPARLAYFLNLHGPAILIDTSCSSSLVAIHLACKGIQSGDCEMALASGINLFTLPVTNNIVNAIGIVAPDGKARSFDDSCEGVGQGEGAGAILLKPLKQALKDNDHIYAVIKSSACNQDGKSIGIMAPSTVAQEKVLVEAWTKAKINPETITYIEAHGTATRLGDPTEISAINRAFKHFTTKKEFCGVGSIKSNIGHTIGAAGVASIIKVVLALQNKELPASIHFEQPNRKIDFINSAVYVNSKLKQWDEPYPRRCGVSSFGISGTNCHILLEEAPIHYEVVDAKTKSVVWFKLLFTLSAKSKESLIQLIKEYIKFMKRRRNLDIYDLCYTANAQRRDYNYRMAICIDSLDMLREKLEKLEEKSFKQKMLEDMDVWMSDNMLDDEAEVKRLEAIKTDFNQKEIFMNKSNVVALAVQYTSGKKIEWDTVYQHKEGHRISLPTYSFKKSRCWFDIPNYKSSLIGNVNRYYEPSWESKLLYGKKACDNMKNCTIICSSGDRFTENYIKILQRQNVKVFCITFGDQAKEIDEYNYVIPDTKEGFDSVFQKFIGKKNMRIIFSGILLEKQSFESDAELEARLQCGIYRFYRMIKSFMEIIKEKTELIVLTDHAYAVSGEERNIKPYHAGLIGFAKTLQWEVPLLHTRCIDIDETTTVESIFDEVMVKSTEYLVCYRGRERFVERIRKAELANKEKTEKTIKPNATYILVGGLGRIGRKLSSIFIEVKANVVFVGRTKLPEHGDWKTFYKEDKESVLQDKLATCLKLEGSGCKVHSYACDVADYKAMKVLLEDIRKQVGPIKGIIQFAVDDCGKQVVAQSEEDFKNSLKSKVYGTDVLNRLTQDDNLDFFIMFSSVMTLVSGNGVSSYVTSNTYLEAYAEYMRRQNRPATVISWSEWLGIGLDEELMNSEDTSLFRKLPYEVGYQAFQQILNTDVTRVIVGEIHLKSKIYELMDYLPFQFADDIKQEVLKKSKQKLDGEKKDTVNVKIKGRKTSIYSKTEELLAQAYYNVLGYEEVDITSNFFEIGGDSISAVKICVEIEDFNLELTPVELLKYQTIESIAVFIDKGKLSEREERGKMIESR